MFNRITTLYLLAFPIGMMGVVHALFAFLSFFIFHDHEESDFLTPSLILLLVAGLFFAIGRRYDVSKVGFRDALIFAVATWVVTGLMGAIPIIEIANVSVADGVFESVSALTTTGATVLSGLDNMPQTFLLYRQFLQWLGGLGVVVFVVAVLPMLNVGGMRLLKAETPGPMKDDKLSPRITHTAHYLLLVYFYITVLCAVAYYLAGMTVFDAIAHSFTTVSTGGFSTHDASMGYFNSPLILMIANVFMLLGAISFSLHFRVWRGRQLKLYWQDEETRSFIVLVILLTASIVFVLMQKSHYDNVFAAISDSLFHLISFITSTGYGAASFTDWPYVVGFLLVLAGYFGGCAGSTAGGNKIVRSVIFAKVLNVEAKRLLHTRGLFSVKFNGKTLDANIVSSTLAFIFFSCLTTTVLTIVMMSTNLDFWTAFTAVAACINVSGPAFGSLSSNFQPVSDAGIWVLSFAMILGRLEYFTVLALFLPMFWRE
ncbi:Trk system potassium uptake protein TrkH [Thalassocella blandensis]|nr:Trk system potassium uptake protein TrkH [Thalassocella blandensis]